MRIKLTYIFILLVFTALSGSAQNFTATVNTSEMSTTNRFQLNFTIDASGKNFTPPDLSNFHVLSGPSQSNQTTIVNGKYSKTVTISYILQPKKVGNFQIGSASIVSGGKTLLTKPINIKVAKNAANTNNDKNLFLKAIVNKTNVYQGEQLVVTFRLYTKVTVLNYTSSKAPALNGFWSQDISQSNQSQSKTEVLNGVNYQVYDIMKKVLFPQRNGTLQIDPFECEFIARVPVSGQRRTNDPFDIFMRNRSQDIKLVASSNAININVKPLPPNAPSSFNGAVGTFDLNATCSPSEVETNDAVNLNVKIKGKGNLKLLESPIINIPNNLESFDPKVNDDISTGSNGVIGSRTFEHIIIPRNPGNYVLDPVIFSYFDLQKQKYVTLNSGKFNFKVTGEPGEMAATKGVKKAEFELLNEDIRFIKTGNITLSKLNTQFIASPAFYTLMAMPILFFGLVIGFKKKIDERLGDTVGNKSRKANKVANKRLAAARKSLAENNADAVYENVLKAIWGYISDKFNILPSELTKEHVTEVLQKQEVDDDTLNNLHETIAECEMGRYSPAHSADRLKIIYDKAAGVITSLESKLK